MSINRLRNVAVRIRPLSNKAAVDAAGDSGVTVPDRGRDGGPSDLAMQPRRPNPDPEQPTSGRPTSKRQIWDLEAEEAPENCAPEEPISAERARAQWPQDPAPNSSPISGHPPAAPAESGRAKTRVLGFHAQDFDIDALDPADSAKKGPQFPAGFLVVVDGPGRGAFFAVTTSVSSIGRAADQDVALDFGDESISREGHASVVYDAEQNRFFLGHGNKANVVRRNGTPVLTTEELVHGDLIRIGKTSLRFHAFCGEDFTWADTDPGEHNE